MELAFDDIVLSAKAVDAWQRGSMAVGVQLGRTPVFYRPSLPLHVPKRRLELRRGTRAIKLIDDSKREKAHVYIDDSKCEKAHVQ